MYSIKGKDIYTHKSSIDKGSPACRYPKPYINTPEHEICDTHDEQDISISTQAD